MTLPTNHSARIAYVLFVDIVGYSRETTSAQARLIAQLNAAVNAAPAFASADASGAVQTLPTGDGMALVFFNDVLAPVQTAVHIGRAARGGALPLRMGMHSGLVLPQVDATGRENLVGEGLNTAQRVMDFGEAGHILLSAQYAAWLQHFDEWTTSLYSLGEGVAKHDLRIPLYNLHSAGVGLASVPVKLGKPTGSAAAATVQKGAPGKSVALLYKPSLQPDAKVLETLQTRLLSLGYEVYVDSRQKISPAWAKAVEEPIRNADAVIAIVSPEAFRSEMLEYEIETAHDAFLHNGKPVLLPVRIGANEPLEGTVASILQPLHFFAWNSPDDDERLVAELLSAITEPLKPRAEEIKLEPVGGAVPPDSPFYVARACDKEFAQALANGESILLVKGARQMGKTSLLAQGTKQARNANRRYGMTDFQKFNTAQMASDEVFYRLLAATLAKQLKFTYDFANEWDEIFGANLNMETFLRALIDSQEAPMVWFMDEVDKLFLAPFASDFFGLVRSWHNSRSTEPDGPWGKLTVVISYATEAHLFIQDLNQSPFNVGRKLELEDFNLQQVIDLNGRYGSPLRSYQEVERLYNLIGGQPFLTRRGLDALATGKYDFETFFLEADRDDGPFNDHLKRILVSVSNLPAVLEDVTALLQGRPSSNRDAYYRLLSAGILKQTREGASVFRCELYQQYLRRHLV
jgi:class 3 adenylate cyclase